ncbi:branched-chain amino acid ABC transporter permease/ATP-binding protein [Nocardia sp. alder85J]|uniref:branched-chain amino acid ABC transporter permease/ATP-binding protein n=1 Tax=Nocardia sp. alder85J TaxID=2862949 RepID=UPI001CD5C8AC|nr:branched-chain amino acid ABC transporter permease/ATP-binding protein [Nocardia sp. alder85J]MCX4096962.1 branched-chain amino acid ABC transporter permease/ATP-binding protein [Nocardia sp. alder85J]
MDVSTFALIGLGTGAINVLLAAGLVLIYRGSGVINFAHGGFALLGAFIVMDLRTQHDMSWPLALGAAVIATAVAGLLVQALVMRPLRTASPLARVIATLGVLTVLIQGVLLEYGAEQRTVPLPVPSGPVRIASDVVVGKQNFYLVAIAVVVVVALSVTTFRTRIGNALTASAENSRAAAALGWSPNLLAALTWGLGGALAGLAGALFPATSTGFISIAQMSVLIVGGLATALLAQFRSYYLALAGGLAIGIIQALTTRYVDQTGVADAVPFLVIVVVLVVRGKGLPVRGTAADRLPRVGTGRAHPAVVVPIAVAAIALLRFATPGDWYPALIVSICFAVIGLSAVVLTGYAGQLSLAQFALGGAGAYVAGRLAAARGWPFELALLAGVVGAMVLGLLFGLPALRTRGVNLAVVTFGLGFALHQILFSNSDYTGGEFQTKPSSLHFFGVDVDPISHADNYSLLCAVWFIVLALVVATVRRGRVGRRLLAVRTNERAAAAIGVSVLQNKLYAFVLSAGIAGVGGVLFGFSYPTVLYQQLFVPDRSITVLVITVIGGVGYLGGPVLGALLVPGGIAVLLFDTSSAASTTDDGFARFVPLLTGIVLVVMLIANQNGLVDQLWQPLRRLGSRWAGEQRFTVAPGPRSAVAAKSLEVRGVTQTFGTFTALTEVSVTIAPGQVVGVLGPNGAGKTTLIDVITGYNRPDSGAIILDQQDITAWPPHRRARAGLVRSFQSLELFDDLTVRENLLASSEKQDLLAYLTGLFHAGTPRLTDTVSTAVEELELTDVLHQRPEELSYARRRLVAIARAIAARPSVLLLDEPAAGLDEYESAELGRLIRRLADDWGIGVLLIEHDVKLVLDNSDRVVVLEFGRVIAEGTPSDIRHSDVVRRAYLGENPELVEPLETGGGVQAAVG